MPKNTGNVQIKQIAEHLGLSSCTVSIVLNGRGDELRISRETQKIVRDTAREMNYQPGRKRKKSRGEQTGYADYRVGVFWNLRYMGGLLGQFYSGFQKAMSQYPVKAEIVLQPFEQDCLHEYVEAFSGDLYHGIIIGGLSEADSAWLERCRFEIPVVLINQPSENYSSVYVDDFQAGKQCAELFAGNGHKKAGIVFSENQNTASTLRYNGFAEGCRKQGILLADEWKVSGAGNGAGGYEAANELLRCVELPTAIFVQTSRMSGGILAALREKNIEVPEQMEIIAYGDREFGQYLYPSVTMLNVSISGMAENAMHLLLTTLQNDLKISLSKLHVTRLVYGDSFRKR